GAIRVPDTQDSGVVGCGPCMALRREAGAGIAGAQLRGIFRLLEEYEVAGASPVKRRHPADAPVEVRAGARLSARERRDLAKREPAAAIEEKGLGHAVPSVPLQQRSEFRSATEAELLDPIIRLLGQRIRIVEP